MIEDYAFVNGTTVVNVVVFDNPTEELLTFFKNEHGVDQIIKATNNTAVGGEYDGINFWLPKPFPSWIKNQEINEWEAPVPYPTIDEENPKYYSWNEDILNWEEVIIEQIGESE